MDYGHDIRFHILDDEQMWQPWKVTLFNQIKSNSVTPPPAIKQSVGTYTITADYTPFVGGEKHKCHTIKGQTLEFLFDGSNYFVWVDDQYLMLSPSDFNECCRKE